MTKDGLKKEASMLDLSADNQDGFDDTDGQLYTSNSLLSFIREICMYYYERRTWTYCQVVGFERDRPRRKGEKPDKAR